MTSKEWKDVKFSDIVTFKYGKMPVKNKILEAGGYPIYSGYRYVGYYNEYNIDKNTLVIVARGVGGTGDVKLTKEKCYLTNLSIAVLPRNNNLINIFYLYYYFLLHNLRYLDSGSAQSQITISDLEKLVIKLPPLEIQEKIARVLSSLDDKIELNNKVNQNLEQQAQAIFKSWFVDFEPFGGKMPDDWRIGKVEEIINIYDNQRIPLSNKERSEMTKKVYPYYGATSLMDYVDNYIFDGIYLLLGEDGTVIDDFGFPILQYVWGKFWVNNHAHIMTGKNGYNVESLYLFFKQKNIKSIVTGAVQAKISQTNLKNLDAIIPTTSTMEEFNKIIAPMFNAIRNNTNEIKILTQLRDMLLPKLMSGEIDVDKVVV